MHLHATEACNQDVDGPVEPFSLQMQRKSSEWRYECILYRTTSSHKRIRRIRHEQKCTTLISLLSRWEDYHKRFRMSRVKMVGRVGLEPTYLLFIRQTPSPI